MELSRFTKWEPLKVTNRVTKSGEGDSMPAEVVESNGRPERARTADLYRVKKEVFPGASRL